MTPPPDSDRVFRVGLPADARSIRSILVESNLCAPSLGNLERATHSRIGEVLTFLAEENGQIVGVLQWRDLGDEAEILDLAVHPAHRRKGYAAFLLHEFFQHASQSPAQKVFLEVRESNAAAIALYKKSGLEISGRRPNYYRNPEENALVMTFSLRG